MRKVEVITQILNANDLTAQENQALLKSHHILAVNLMASPGAGKTSLILQTAEALSGRVRLGVIEGDVASRIDADKVAAVDIPVIQINTGGECHLDALTVQKALKTLPLAEMDILVIENVGNLICLSEYRLGEEIRVVVASVPEGTTSPTSTGHFHGCQRGRLEQDRLAPYVDFKRDAMREGIVRLNPRATIFEPPAEQAKDRDVADWLNLSGRATRER
jgi:hydrogenase nickel incorporation protein HypB